MKSCLEGSSTTCLKSLRKGKLTSNIINLYLTNYERIVSPSSDSINDRAPSTASEWMPHALNANDLNSLDGPMLAVSVAVSRGVRGTMDPWKAIISYGISIPMRRSFSFGAD